MKDIKMQYAEFVKNKINEVLPAMIEDNWYSFSENIDINIWSSEDEPKVMYAAAYDVVNGHTQTDHWVQIEILD